MLPSFSPVWPRLDVFPPEEVGLPFINEVAVDLNYSPYTVFLNRVSLSFLAICIDFS